MSWPKGCLRGPPGLKRKRKVTWGSATRGHATKPAAKKPAGSRSPIIDSESESETEPDEPVGKPAALSLRLPRRKQIDDSSGDESSDDEAIDLSTLKIRAAGKKRRRLAGVDRDAASKTGTADASEGETGTGPDCECGCELRFKGDNDVSSNPIWVLPGGAHFPADACKAVCRECDGPLHDPWESRGTSFGCDVCC